MHTTSPGTLAVHAAPPPSAGAVSTEYHREGRADGFIPARGRRRVSLNRHSSATYAGGPVTASRNCQPNRSPDSAFEYDTSMQSWRPSGFSCVWLRPAAPSDGSDQPAHFTSPTMDTAGFGGGLGPGPGPDQLLGGSSFALNRATSGGDSLSFWSRSASSSFAGRENLLALSGDVRTTIFGADYAKGRMVAGVWLSPSRGWAATPASTSARSRRPSRGSTRGSPSRCPSGVTVWTVAGYGADGLMIDPGAGSPIQTGLSMAMAAGVRSSGTAKASASRSRRTRYGSECGRRQQPGRAATSTRPPPQ